ncbi:MAG TPA: uracil-DNA glycosylase family protein [Bacteroidia bacterium]|nr:uracil-DNA glycosylase family protein [Bacteroidia bacterium]
MTDKNQSLIELFRKEFANFEGVPEKPASAIFKCIHAESCVVDLTKEAAYTGILGDTNTDIMIVAESPTTRYGTGCFWGGNINNLLERSEKNLKSLIQFIINYDEKKRKPYFTDTIKCGLEKTREKEKLSPRKNNCTQKFLLKEIEIIQPKLIVCLGDHSYKILDRLKTDNKINHEIDLIKLHHYSNRASLTLTIEDKENIIWPIQFNLLKKDEAAQKVLTIKHLKEMLNKISNE